VNAFPPLFIERLNVIIPPENIVSVLEQFSVKKKLAFRVNTLKAKVSEVLEYLQAQNFFCRPVSWNSKTFLADIDSVIDLNKTGLMADGKIYIQNLSSMLPALILDPHPDDYVLDLCAAPGSKTSQMADLMSNKGEIVAVEHIKPRFYKLKSVLSISGVLNTQCYLSDGRRFRHPRGELFDKILVDAPCSSEGRFSCLAPKTYAYWSIRKIKEMQKKQRGLLLAASRLLKSGGTLVYATCTFAPEENEAVVDWLLRKADNSFHLVPCTITGVKDYRPILHWQGKDFSSEVKKCFRVLPDHQMDGFFIACFKKD